MGKKGLNLKEEKKKAITSINGLVDDLIKLLDDKEAEIVNKLTNANIDLERIKEETEKKKLELSTKEARIKHLNSTKEELDKREKRIIKTEEILEEEKKIMIGKKQHLIEWETELNTKARRLNG